jgi:hypothetical protein
MMLGWPAVASGHVNRTIGPYTILVVLVEEPLFQDNHAGFEFWVRKDGAPLTGLEQTLHAQAAGHGVLLDMAISPLDPNGFYVVDRATSGAAFDPHGGGAWSLRLRGTIGRTPVDEWFAVSFPGYPRVSAGTAPNAEVTSGAGSSPAQPLWLIPAVSAAIVVSALALRAALRGRQSAEVL